MSCIYCVISPFSRLTILYGSMQEAESSRMQKKKGSSPMSEMHNIPQSSEMNFKYWLNSRTVGMSFKGIDLAAGESSQVIKLLCYEAFGTISTSLSPVYGLWSLSYHMNYS